MVCEFQVDYGKEELACEMKDLLFVVAEGVET